jgi:hypothetical protein
MLFTALISSALMAAGGGHAEWHPADANIFVEIAAPQSICAAYEESALFTLANDLEILSLFATLNGADPETLDATDLLEKPLEGMLDSLKALAPELFQALFLAQEAEGCSFSVSGLELRGLAPLLLAAEYALTPEIIEHFGTLCLRLVCERPGATAEEQAQFVTSLGDLLGFEGTNHAVARGQGEDAGETLKMTVWSNPAWLGAEVFSVFIEGKHIVGLGRGASGKFMTEDIRLASNPGFEGGRKQFRQEEGLAVYELYANADGLGELGALFGGDGAESSGALALDWRMLTGAGHFEWHTRTHMVEGRFIMESFNTRGDGPKKFCDVLGQTPVTKADFQMVPAGATAVWATTIDKEVLGEVIAIAIADATGGNPEVFLQGLEGESGLNIQRDLVDAIGETLVFYAMPFTGPSMPKMYFALELVDAEAFARGLEQMGAIATALSGNSLRFSSRPYRKHPVMSFASAEGFAIDVPSEMMPLLSGLLNPSLAIGILEDRAILSLSGMHTKREMKRLLKDGGEAHALAMPESRLPAGAVFYRETDWGAQLDSLYVGLKAFFPLLQQGFGDFLTIGPEDLPGDDLFSRHISTTVSWSAKRPHGTYSYSESSFGPELLCALGAGIGAALFTEESEGPAELAPAEAGASAKDEPGESPTQQTREALRDIKVGIMVFRGDTGRFPTALGDLTGATAGYPSGYLATRAVPLDGWGRTLLYELEDEDAAFRIWSSGPNGQDEGGVGDDVNLAQRR